MLHLHIILALLGLACFAECGNVTFSASKLTVQVNTTGILTVNITAPFSEDTTIYFQYDQGGAVTDDPDVIVPLGNITIQAGRSEVFTRNVSGIEVGNLILFVNSTSEINNPGDCTAHVYVVRSWPLVVLNQVIGWCYFVAWSVSFYPQIVLNILRRSVVGLNFDFVLYNLTGFFAYSVFNVAFYFDTYIFALYEELHPRGVNPVELNDVIFALHALFLTAVTGIQILIFERGDQRVSKICVGLLTLMWLFLGVSLIVGVVGKLSWLTYLYFFSYCKLAITLIKYIPQAYLNYVRQSTDGWSIGNILLDFAGGSLSILQMFLLAYNNEDWNSIFGNPTKFGLGLFSVLFDIVFIVQHYCLYRGNDAHGKRLLLENEEEEDAESERSLPCFPGPGRSAASVDSRDET